MNHEVLGINYELLLTSRRMNTNYLLCIYAYTKAHFKRMKCFYVESFRYVFIPRRSTKKLVRNAVEISPNKDKYIGDR
jgi:hypothetical protein